MAREHNFLLGNGEKLTKNVRYVRIGGPKDPPYQLTEATLRFKKRAREVSAEVQHLPIEACPGGEAVLSIMLHPRYLSKSDDPTRLFAALGLRSVGSRMARIKPDKWGYKKKQPPATEVLTEEIFVAGARNRILQLETAVDGLAAEAMEYLSHIEKVSFQHPTEKLKNPPGKDRGWLEVVLHNDSNIDILSAFSLYATKLGASVDVKRSRKVGGLTFVPVSADGAVSERIARFSFLRVARSMPTLRPFRPTLLRALSGEKAVLPTGGVLSDGFRTLIFDGGIPKLTLPSLDRWVTLIEPSGIGPSDPDLEAHGLAVTSAFLFGPIQHATNLNQPLCRTDHVRVVDIALRSSVDPYYFDVLQRILDYLDAHGSEYDLINLSIGPKTPIDDDDVTLWTSALDQRCSTGQWVVSVAAGNDGDADATAGLNRVQPPGDGVNMLTVGASDSLTSSWKRASYSCQGPGRCPGIVKPDGIAFGGSDREEFSVLSSSLEIEGTQGTSFASPFALRSGASIKAQLGNSLGSLAIRALMIHTAKSSSAYGLPEIGWGRFEDNPEHLITCEDNEALVIYQGELPLGQQLRAPIPLPPKLNGRVEISATVVISTEVDPGHPSAYTRSGLTVAFRPHEDRYNFSKKGKMSTYPKTITFFSPSNMYGTAEFELREEGCKWEPCHHGHIIMNPDSLKSPCFDIYNHHRLEGSPDVKSVTGKYALVVTVKAESMKDFYDAVVRAYSQVLIPLRPTLRIQV